MTVVLEYAGESPEGAGAALSPQVARSSRPAPSFPAALPSVVNDERAVMDWLLCARALNLVDLDPLPSESDLRALLRAPRQAVRAALGNLAAAGLIRRRRSVGTSVPGSEEKLLGALWSTKKGPQRSYQMLATERLRGNQVARALFHDPAAPAGTEELVRIQRLTLNTENTALSLCSIYLTVEAHERVGDNAWRLPSTEAAELIAGRPVTGDYTINALPADAESSTYLGVQAGSPCLHLERVFRDGNRVVLAAFARLPGIRVGIRTNLIPD